jgi:hypothetical protein
MVAGCHSPDNLASTCSLGRPGARVPYTKRRSSVCVLLSERLSMPATVGAHPTLGRTTPGHVRPVRPLARRGSVSRRGIDRGQAASHTARRMGHR